ncbi:MAG TPA: AAA domain-containing protein, partial [Opitutaceae bacterium]|nr:AAA domain-containing protein [Opitutaceae bacterium]
LKEIYSAGRRELEHEFSKTQRRRSIRELADNETGIVIRDLKPIWLMSPLSVSDTIPLSSEAFDVVIFDEASQIPVEEAIPAIYRAQQIIVVGDEMQLPPTNFFSATRSTDPLLFDGGADDVSADDLDADSLLKQASINLPSTMLGWHYRSRSETLISYSNAAFYESQLMTIPDRQIAAEGLNEIIVTKSEDGIAHIEALLKRRVSFHFVPKAVYEQRRNRAEADYIAHLLKEMLAQETKLTLGVVAFSEAQQTEIESALERLSAKDSLFARRLEAEYEREDEGQFCGFFVKNLENVQGDERDIIILSICYGYDRNRRMLMNFGPINQQGGEKRLNVIFSRAREHMVVVSSIRHTDITNDYNDGANCLRNFLEYAHACSKGEGAAAQRVLRTISPQKMPRAQSDANDPVVLQLADALKARGFVVETQVGQSEFRLPLAIRRSSVDQHALGILVDDGVHYAQKDILERYLLRPEVLESFGWKVALVLTKDWYHDPEGVLRHLERAVSGASKPKSNLIAIASPSRSGSSSRSKGEAEGGKTATVVLEADDKTDSRSYRHFEMHENGVMKFWDIAADGNEIAVRFGRKSSNATVQTKTFSSAAEAGAELERLVRSKVAKGYVESTG